MNLHEVVGHVLRRKGAVYAESQVGTELGHCYRIIYHVAELNPKPMLYFTLCGAPVSEVAADLEWRLLAVSCVEKVNG